MSGRYAKSAGFISLRALFWLLFLASAFYGAYKFGPPYAAFYMLKIEVEGVAKTAHMYTDEKLAERIKDKAASWSVPLGEDSLEIVRGAENVSISIYYTVVVDFFGRYSREIDYSIEVEEPLKETGRVLQ